VGVSGRSYHIKITPATPKFLQDDMVFWDEIFVGTLQSMLVWAERQKTCNDKKMTRNRYHEFQTDKE
jgi:hypothetical protein